MCGEFPSAALWICSGGGDFLPQSLSLVWAKREASFKIVLLALL